MFFSEARLQTDTQNFNRLSLNYTFSRLLSTIPHDYSPTNSAPSKTDRCMVCKYILVEVDVATLTRMSRVAPKSRGRPSRSLSGSSGSYRPCGCTRRPSQWSHCISDTPASKERESECQIGLYIAQNTRGVTEGRGCPEELGIATSTFESQRNWSHDDLTATQILSYHGIA